MTRFKPLRRIENAVKYRDRVELEWAANYCRQRIQVATLKRGQDYWRQIEKRVKLALSESENQN